MLCCTKAVPEGTEEIDEDAFIDDFGKIARAVENMAQPITAMPTIPIIHHTVDQPFCRDPARRRSTNWLIAFRSRWMPLRNCSKKAGAGDWLRRG